MPFSLTEPWTLLGITGSWNASVATTLPPAYYKDFLGIVHLQGTLQG